MSDQHHKENEEVDLGSLFIIIGKGFSKLFSFIGSIFKAIFSFLIEILLFFKENIVKLGIACLIGVGVGLLLEKTSGDKYEGNLYVKPNFGSTRELYNSIKFYNDLVKQKKSTHLIEIFNISPEEAESLKSFKINPVINENDILTSFDELIQVIDTSTVKSYSYEKFKNAFTKFDYKVHEISVVSNRNNFFAKLSEPIISSIINNSYFKNLKKINKQNLLRTDSLLRKNLQKADSLHHIYKKVLLEEAKKTSLGTNIDLGQRTNNSNKELKLFDTDIKINKSLIEINDDLSEKSEVINIISDFQPIGHEIKEIEKNKAFQFGLVGLAVMIIGLLLLKLNSYLEAYKDNK